MSPDAPPPRISRRWLRLTAFSAAILFAGVAIFGLVTRHMAEARITKWTEDQAVPAVAVIRPDTKSLRDSLSLPGRLEAYSQAQLFARVSGYLKEWHADTGTPVQAGQLLAEIDAPDLDQQIMQAQANLGSAKANSELAEGILQRGKLLIPNGSISQQVLDQRSADASNKRGLLNSAQADLDRLRVLENYKRIVAPFTGLVTARATDVGSLINAGTNSGPALFVVSDVSKLRLYVNVPQNFAPRVPVGTKANLTVPEYPGVTFTAVVESSSRSIDAASGTTRMQLAVDNSSGQLLTGAYATVQLNLTSSNSAVSIPATTLIFDRMGMRVATVGHDSRVAMHTVTISRDLGKVVEIGSGLMPEDVVIDSPPDGIVDGDLVKVTKGAPPETKLSSDDEKKPIQ